MAASPILPLLIFIQMLVLVFVSAQKHNVTLGSTLTPSKNPKWVSANGRFAFGFYRRTPTAYVVGVWFDNIPPKTLAWTAMKGKNDVPVEEGSTLQLTDSGIRLYDGQRNLLWSAVPSEKVAAAAMLDNGNFVLLNASLQPIWQSFDLPTDTLLPGQTLQSGSNMYPKASTANYSAGRFVLAMQEDGNLVLYTVDRVGSSEGAYWASNTYKLVDNPTSLIFDPSGALYLVNSTNITVATLADGKAGGGQFLRRVTLDTNGILGQYVWNINGTAQTTSWSSVWRPVEDPCKGVKGQCGINGICQLTTENEADCICPAQFVFIDNADHFKGCVPKSSQLGQSCAASSTMSVLQNTDWTGGRGYSVLSGLSESGCQQACLDDCTCIVATYANTVCAKKQMPMLDGRQGTDITIKAFVKVPDPDPLQVQPPFSLPPQHQLQPTEREGEGKGKGEGKALVVIGISLLAGSSIVLASSFLLICLSGHGRQARIVGEAHKVVEGLKAFSYKEIEAATGGFRQELGRGAFGKVYKGTLRDGRAIAVKNLDKMVQEEHGEKEFRTEMSVIGTSHHKNLVQLYGFCDEGSHRLLVYEYMTNGSLDTALFVDSGFLDWSVRVQIAIGTARGILYLHEECRTQILHCDIKPQNILLDNTYNPKISDFGLAKLLRAEQTRTYTGARGTKGYIAPEWIKNSPITVKADVYSFGVMLLEIICCRKTMELDAPENEILLSDWVYECLQHGALGKLVEQQRVEGMRIESRKLERMVLVGLWCIQEEPSLRPSIKMVVQMLEGTIDIAVPPPPLS